MNEHEDPGLTPTARPPGRPARSPADHPAEPPQDPYRGVGGAYVVDADGRRVREPDAATDGHRRAGRPGRRLPADSPNPPTE